MRHWQTIEAEVVRGYGVASGSNNNPRFPGGTLRMQAPYFLERGLDLGQFHLGTVNLSIAPQTYRVVHPHITFRHVQWHPTEPAEDFSFFDVRLVHPIQGPVEGLIYYPHPDTKPEHFQQPDVLELLLPFVRGLEYGMPVQLEVPPDQMVIDVDQGEPNPAVVPPPRPPQPKAD